MTRRRQRTVAVPPARHSFTLWDATDGQDSRALGELLLDARWTNRVPRDHMYATGNPRVLQPGGPEGSTASDELMTRGILQLPHVVFGYHEPELSGSLVALSGHGVPGFVFTEEMVPIAMSQPISVSGGGWHYAHAPTWQGAATRVIISSACRQLQGRRQQYYWSQAMRRERPVRMMLSYHQTGPNPGVSASINRRFMASLRAGSPILEAWREVHSADTLRWRWAALCYEESVDDTFLHWNRTGELESAPRPDSPILYFDSGYPDGVEVTPIVNELDAFVCPRGQPVRLPPWSMINPGSAVDIRIQLLAPGVRVDDDDRLILCTAQVRPDYAGPFNIEHLLTVPDQAARMAAGEVRVARAIHESDAYGNDTYVLPLAPSCRARVTSEGVPAIRLSPDRREILVPARVGAGDPDNYHLPLYYFHVALVKGRDANERYGMNRDDRLEDYPQFGMFRLPWRGPQ